MRQQSFLWIMSVLTAFLLPGLLGAQTASTTKPGCQIRSATDTGKVVLVDSTAPSRWSKDILDAVGRHEICIGMSVDMLRKSWGLPPTLHATIPRMPGDTTVQFQYHGASVILVNSIIRAIRPPSNAGRR